MNRPPASVLEVRDKLQNEFQRHFSARTITEVVIRLSANGAVSLPVLESMAKRELQALTTADRDS